jgi:YVTN family beta-propeller protein
MVELRGINIRIRSVLTASFIAVITLLLATSTAGAATAEPYVYVSNYGDDTISVINTSTNEVVATLSTGDAPKDVVLTQDRTKAYVINMGTHSVQVINTATNTPISTIPIDSYPYFPYALAMTPDETKVYVISSNNEDASHPVRFQSFTRP